MADYRYCIRHADWDEMLQIMPWKAGPNGFHSTQSGNIRLMVEKVGARFRVLVTLSVDEMQPEEVVYAGSTGNAGDAMTIAERVAAQIVAQAAPPFPRIYANS